MMWQTWNELTWNEIIMEQSDQILQGSVMENWVPPFGGSLWPNSLHTIQSVALNNIHRKGFESWSTNTIKGHPTTQGAWWNSCNYDRTNKYSDVFFMDKDEFLHLLTDGPKHNVARFRPLDLNFSWWRVTFRWKYCNKIIIIIIINIKKVK